MEESKKDGQEESPSGVLGQESPSDVGQLLVLEAESKNLKKLSLDLGEGHRTKGTHSLVSAKGSKNKILKKLSLDTDPKV